MADLLETLEAEAKARFVRWDPALWRATCDGPAQALSEALLGGGGDLEAARTLVETYLRLAQEGIGLGYLFPASAGIENVFSLFWNKLLPAQLAKVPEAARAETLARCWNLAENLERAPLWLRRIFHLSLRALPDLGALESAVAQVEARAAEPPAQKLDQVRRVRWVHLGVEDKRFLPGAVHFLAPRVVCVHDRERTAAGGREGVTYGVWLDANPLFLGPLGCRETVAPTAIPDAHLERAAQLDPRFTDVHDAALAPHALACTLVTSQTLVVLEP